MAAGHVSENALSETSARRPKHANHRTTPLLASE